MRVVITGGTCAGKTSVVNFFAAQGYHTIAESGQQVTEELINKWGMDEMNRFRKECPLEFLDLVAQRQSRLEHNIPIGRPVIFDRVMHDYVAYCRLIKVEPPPKVLKMLNPKYKYDMIFLLETLQEFQSRDQTGRTHDKDFSNKWRDAVCDIYKEHGFKPIRVKEMPLSKRIDFIKKKIDKHLDSE